MNKKKVLVFIIIFLSIVLCLIFLNMLKKKEISQINISPKVNTMDSNKKSFSSNIIENVKYSSRDSRGNTYTITAKEGEIDINNTNIIFLKNVEAEIKLNNSNNITMSSNFGKYDITNFNTIFSKNVTINYLENIINSEYLDFSINRNSMIISKNVVYKDKKNTLKTDVIEINISTKDTKFFMYNQNEKVSLERINWNGYNKKI